MRGRPGLGDLVWEVFGVWDFVGSGEGLCLIGLWWEQGCLYHNLVSVIFYNEKEIGFEWVYKIRNGLVGMGL